MPKPRAYPVSFEGEVPVLPVFDAYMRNNMPEYAGWAVEPNGTVRIVLTEDKPVEMRLRLRAFVQQIRELREARGEPEPEVSPDRTFFRLRLLGQIIKRIQDLREETEALAPEEERIISRA